ncbi:glycoside hydrolase family 88 protein [Paenibacillus polymyxa]|uniref:glycoside hydrolase family 88 protein n=1 Tax=Paenibacillus TaxID=44249 RepID=UPI0002D305F0|nr:MULTISPECIES: glycoside hydrolase family 88 protein [Paenibacillus]KAF6655228.1 glycoside hydrolase family 88 protein [Paenibacillus sp. EKM301P]MBE3646901.1 glycosyl hydrolase family 88 [Paenibacillus polymyxa]MEE4563871.1 glycoside hydrolase family 88 protein [Paenibacillus polymyxa]NMP10290.1 glycosyl hydrolase family 88 [Paenibacillus polymyxa]RPE03967.1 glycosyl hydrolase family 88 [Paenibacillus polymyxa]
MLTLDSTTVWVNEIIDQIIAKMEWLSEKSRNKIPYTTIDGEHDDRSVCNPTHTEADGINWWTNGFWGGMLWQMYHATGNPRYKDVAEISEQKLDACFHNYYGLHHDVGFMWLPTSVANFKLTQNPVSRKRAMHAANLLAGRYNLAGEFIRAWNDLEGEDTRGWAIIDCMLNIPLLYWASEETGDPRFRQIAVKHADMTMNTFVRADGSVNHIVELDPFVGGVVKTYGGQGYEEGSSWTRGQSWALYGFMMSYNHTQKEEYLNTAKRVAHYFIANIPENGVIPVDFRQPKEPALEDSTAAAIAACGLIEIAKVVGLHEKDMYLRAAIKLLQALHVDWTTGCDCILKNGSASYHATTHHQSIIYGDYFFIEAMFKLKGSDLYFW